ncbi:MAG: hypothetical protein B7733_23030 [Myxococcales bacterium FL481]|nr:MAG: hypothetical protein B7733_23030 [Myxococcales bacterium FL481]
MDAEILKTAASAPRLDKLKVRVDPAGRVVKQALYHHDANAIPQPVRELAAQEFPGSTPTRFETEYYAATGRAYEVEVKTQPGRNCEVAATAEGVKLYVECHVDPSVLPPPVAETVRRVAAGAKIIEAEHTIYASGDEEFSIELETPQGEVYVQVRADGTLIGRYRVVPAMIEVPLP